MNNSLSPFDHKPFLATLTQKPGVYCMFDRAGTVIYVGKARNLKKRLTSYFNSSAQTSPKTRSLVASIATIEVTITHTEKEALILENTLIKTHLPRYNILLRDDKTYPFLHLSDHPFPRLSLHRGAKRAKGKYFGPYPHVKAVYDSLNLLQKLFLVRSCQDSVYGNRSRPCLLYQIKRCSGPCVRLIDTSHYQEEVNHAILFLEGKSQTVVTALVEKMEAASARLDYEQAAHYRDQISSLRSLQERQYVSTEGGNIDIVVALMGKGVGCIQVTTVRNGLVMGSRAYFPQHIQEADEPTLLAAFLPQYYLTPHRGIPQEIIVNHEVEEMSLIAEAIGQQHPIHIHSRVKSARARWLEMTVENAKISLSQHQPDHYRERLAALTVVLNLPAMPRWLECFDVSHTAGEATVASCVVFDDQGPRHSAYRHFNIEQITPGDDYAALKQALTRRYRKIHDEKTEGVDTVQIPDILFIDGGSAQARIARQVLIDYDLKETLIIGVAKGAGRRPGLESLILANETQPLLLPQDSPALHLIQHLRDEAHRFALTNHRRRRNKARQTSVLEQIEGIGPKRRQQLLKHFGGLQGIVRAGVEDLTKIPGINKQLAQKIYDFFTNT